MELVLLIILLIFHLGRSSLNSISEASWKAKEGAYQSVFECVGLSPSWLHIEMRIQHCFKDPEKRESCFNIIDVEMSEILGDNWKENFLGAKSEYIFQHIGWRPEWETFKNLEMIPYLIFLAKTEGRSYNKFIFRRIGGFTVEDSEEIIRKTCRIIQIALKSKHKDLWVELDMFFYEPDYPNGRGIYFRYTKDRFLYDQGGNIKRFF